MKRIKEVKEISVRDSVNLLLKYSKIKNDEKAVNKMSSNDLVSLLYNIEVLKSHIANEIENL